MTKYAMPTKSDQELLWGAVASLKCQVQGCEHRQVQVAHSNQQRDGKGMGLKAYPWRVAAVCPEHHIEMDSGKNLTKSERREMFDEAHRSTIGELFSLGLLRPVNPKKALI